MTVTCFKCHTPVPDQSRFCLSCGENISGDPPREPTERVEAGPALMLHLQGELGGDYVLERELGRGGMAVVYLGRDTHLKRKVAVKVLPPEFTLGSGAMIDRFKREAEVAATLDHPHIIPVYRVSTSGNLFWYAMKYLEGESLDKILHAEGQLSVDRTTGIVSQIAEALDHAHRNQVVHRDVKPANVMLDARGWVTVTDFGIAKALDASSLTASGSMIGTPHYMSPEQCSGKRVGPASDQYSLAVMAFQMLGGHLPFAGDSMIDVIRKHCMDPVPPLGVFRPGLPRQLIAVIERGLAKTPEERFGSTADFARAMAAAAGGLHATFSPPRAASADRMSRTAMVSPVPGVLRSARGLASRRKLVIGATVAVSAVAISVLAWPRSEVPRPGPTAENTPTRPAAPADSVVQPHDSLALPQPSFSSPDSGVAQPPASAGRRGALATLRLRSVRASDLIIIDQRDRRFGESIRLTPGEAHSIKVSRAGFEPWTYEWTPRPGQVLPLTPTFQALAAAGAAVSAPSQPAPSGALPPQTQPTVANAYLSVATIPRSLMVKLDGQALGPSPIPSRLIPHGRHTLSFRSSDSLGEFNGQDTTFSVAANDTLRMLIRLRRPQ